MDYLQLAYSFHQGGEYLHDEIRHNMNPIKYIYIRSNYKIKKK